jgi:hypothetical protein
VPYCPSCGAVTSEKDQFCPYCGADLTEDEQHSKKSQVSSSYDDESQSANFAYEEQPPPPPPPEKSMYGDSYKEEYSYGYTSQQQTRPGVAYVEPLQTRNYWIWLLIIICTGGLGAILYLYLTLSDLNKLDTHPKPAGVPSTHIDMNQMLIILLFGIFCGFSGIVIMYLNYIKYDKLHNYIEAHPIRQQNKCASGTKYLLVSIVATLLSSVSFVFVYMALMITGGFSTAGGSLALIILFSVIGLISLGLGIFRLILEYQWQEAYNERALLIDPNTIQSTL